MKRNNKIILKAILITTIALVLPFANIFGNIKEAEGTNQSSTNAKAPSKFTIEENQKVYALLDFEDEQELEFAKRGLISAPEKLEIKDQSGKIVWSQKAFASYDKEAPDTVNPSLWKNTKLNSIYGLFEVTEGIYQVRGYDMSNLTVIKGDTGWIVFDPLISLECAKAAMDLINKELGERPVAAVIFSHPHVDHYGGIKGIIDENSNIPIIAPEGFEEHAISENMYAGTAMGRRASYQYGTLLEKGENGALSIGIGMGQSIGTSSYMSPNDIIKETGEIRTIDGITMEFQMTPGTEAPAEMNTWIKDKKALWMAENCTGTLHNLYTLRGAQVRDGNAWAEYIMESISLYGKEVEVVFQAHNWPHWDNEKIIPYMENTAAMYKFINDKTLQYINLGYTMNEIANMIQLPEGLEKNWYTRQYYGTVSHNSKAVYQKFMGWYDANPVHLAELAPTESAKKYVEYLGSQEEVLRKAKSDYDKGNYQWVAEITNVLVFADPNNKEARNLCADALEQLAYKAESGTWRNAYLTGAKELRQGTVKDYSKKANGNKEALAKAPVNMMLDYFGIILDSNKAEHMNLKINLEFTDEKPYLLSINNGVMLYQKNTTSPNPDATLILEKSGLFEMINGKLDNIKIEGDKEAIIELISYCTSFEYFFNIVEP